MKFKTKSEYNFLLTMTIFISLKTIFVLNIGPINNREFASLFAKI